MAPLAGPPANPGELPQRRRGVLVAAAISFNIVNGFFGPRIGDENPGDPRHRELTALAPPVPPAQTRDP
ncbi:MAG: hypothetical protein EXS13_13310 [Planctomycetes bacterium]|nr:hypothetical protein [Planctomycetota bacterium]